jgi:hypothetical protein
MLMRDSINASLIPTDTPVVAGYGDGLYMWSSADWARFPNSVALSIVVNAVDIGDILDVERSDASPTDVPGWVRRFNRPNRRKPTIYSDRNTWPQIVAALEAAGMSAGSVDWWAATLDGTQVVAGAVAVQYIDTGAYHESIILDETWVTGKGGSVITDTVVPVSPVVGKTFQASTTWLDWNTLQPVVLSGIVQTIGPGQEVIWTEAKLENGVWYDRIEGPGGAPGDWCLPDTAVDDGGFDPTHFRPPAPPPPPPPPPAPVVDQVARDALKAMRDVLNKAGL